MKLNRTLSRQLNKLKLSTEDAPSKEKWTLLLELLNEHYDQNDEGRYLLERSLDISSEEMRQKEKLNKEITLQLAQASKLAAIGTLASGVAHELNNPLAAIKGFAEIVMRGVDDKESKTFKHLMKIKIASDRMANIIKSMLKFSHKSTSETKQELELSCILDETLEIIGPILRNDNIHISIYKDRESFKTFGEASKMVSVFQNLLTNSRDAYWDNKIHSNKSISIQFMTDNNYNQIIYQDNAGGIPDSKLGSIFDPFFTTKPVGSGTGLGLSITKQNIEELGGSLNVINSEGGVKFTIRLPVSDLEESSSPTNSIGNVINKNSRLNQPNVLVIDDEPDICSILGLALGPFMDVKTISDSLEAKKLIDQDHFDIIITDIKMPEVSGFDIIQHVQSNSPDSKIVIMSGNLNTDCPKEIRECKKILKLEKPFGNLTELPAKILNHTIDDDLLVDAA